MKKNKKKVKIDVILLYFRRRRIRDALMKRWWELEAKRKELYKLVEYAKIQSRYCVNLDCHRIAKQIPQRTGARGTTYLQTSDQIRHLGFQTRLLDRPL